MSSNQKPLYLLPSTTVVMLWTAFVPVIVSVMGWKYYLDFRFDPYIFVWGQYWRLFANQLAFNNESQMFFGVVLLFKLKVLERFKSSHKFISFIVLIYFLNIVLIASANFVAKFMLPDSWNFVQSFNYCPGPFPMFGALLYEYIVYIPVSYKFEIIDILPESSSMGSQSLVLTDKIFVYVLATQLFFSSGLSSMVPFLNGYFLGFLVSAEILPGKNWKVPILKPVYKFYYKYTKPVVSSARASGTVDTAASADADLEVATRQSSPESDPEPVRPLATQFLDNIRR